MKKKKIIIDASFETETRVVVIDEKNLIENVEYDSESQNKIHGNIYLSIISRVEPSLQAAFLNYGSDRSGFLSLKEIHPDYYDSFAIDKKNESLQSHENSHENEINLEHNLEEFQREQQYIENNVQNDDNLVESDYVDVNVLEDVIDEETESNIDITAGDAELDMEDQNKISRDKNYLNKYKIHEVIKKDQLILVQALKEEKGNKGAVFTTYISLAGRYCVLMPNKILHNGVSKKISNINERKRLKAILDELNNGQDNESCSIVARTAAYGCSASEIKKDYLYLVKLWNDIRDITLKSHAPCFIHEEESIILRTIRDLYDSNVEEILVQGKKAYEECVNFMEKISPQSTSIVKYYDKKKPIFTKLKIEEQLTNLYQSRADLPSGGYIIIHPTEALISIDVNSGKSTGDRDVEKMALNTNLEAAKEIARQIRLRELSGLIVVDFIDMYQPRNRRLVERYIKECMSSDKAKVNIGQISNFGLLELSRQRIKPSFSEVYTTICDHCDGKGLVRAENSNFLLILRTIENEIYGSKNVNVVNIYAVQSVVSYMLNNKRNAIKYIEDKYDIKLYFYVDHSSTSSDRFSIEKLSIPDNKELKLKRIPALKTNIELGDKLDKINNIEDVKKTSNTEKKKINSSMLKMQNKEKKKLPPTNLDKEIVVNDEYKEKQEERVLSPVEVSDILGVADLENEIKPVINKHKRRIIAKKNLVKT